MIIRFGKYEGYRIDDQAVPTSYLLYVVENFSKTDALVLAALEELLNRIAMIAAERGIKINVQGAAEQQKTAAKRVYRTLATKYHPDKGGNVAAMQAVNEFYELLKQ